MPWKMHTAVIFLIQNLFVADEIKTIYSQIDRIIVGAATPVNKELVLEAGAELRAKYFLERREMGIINICLLYTSDAADEL